MRLLPCSLLLSCLLHPGLPAVAQTDAERALAVRENQQRAWIAQARASYQTQFQAREKACYQRFAVNDCLAQSRRSERDVMGDLRRQEILINDAQRKRRAAEQLLRSDQKLHGTP